MPADLNRHQWQFGSAPQPETHMSWSATRASSFLLDVFQPDTATRTQAFARLFNSAQEAWVVFKAIFEPAFFRLEPNQHLGRLAMARDDDLLRLSFAKIT